MFGWFGSSRQKREDAALDAAVEELERRVDAELSLEDQHRLFLHLGDIRRDVAAHAAARSLSEKDAFRLFKRAAAKSMAGFLEVERMLPAREAAA